MCRTSAGYKGGGCRGGYVTSEEKSRDDRHCSGREFPRRYIEQALRLLGSPPPVRTIVELGSLRHLLTHTLDIDVQAECCLYGHSTVHWARSGHRVFSVDIDVAASELTQVICEDHDNVIVVTDDGIEFLATFAEEIDLLYLDAWDLVLGTDFAEKHLEAFETAQSKLAYRHLILIDDTDLHHGGKGQLLLPRLDELGYECITAGRQTLLRSPSVD